VKRRRQKIVCATDNKTVSTLRILPLISSATEIVHALGLGQYQVGRSHECDYPIPVSNLPVCTMPAFAVSGSSEEIDRLVKERLAAAASIYEIDAELVRRLDPTHIITQTQCKVCAVSLEDVERALRTEVGITSQIIPLEPYALDDLWRDIRRIAIACEHESLGDRLISNLQDRMRTICTRAQMTTEKPRVAAIEWLEPLMAAGNWVPELIEMACGQNLFGIAGQHSPWMTWEELTEADPDILIALPCGFDLERTNSEMKWLTGRPGWHQLRAVRTGKVFTCDGNQYMNRPGPRLVESLQIFAEIMHPQYFAPMLEGSGWIRWTGSASE
jgi:iron complex transport system substrate-binding protein